MKQIKSGKQLFDMDVRYCHHILNIFNGKQEEIPLHKGNLFLGGVGSFKQPVINGYRITGALSILDKGMMSRYMINQKCQHLKVNPHKWIDLEDEDQSDIFQHFQDTNKYILQTLQNHNVLVHCQVGVSRSATLVTAFIMREYKLGVNQAINYVRSRRNIISPNQGFIKALKKYQETITKK